MIYSPRLGPGSQGYNLVKLSNSTLQTNTCIGALTYTSTITGNQATEMTTPPSIHQLVFRSPLILNFWQACWHQSPLQTPPFAPAKKFTS